MHVLVDQLLLLRKQFHLAPFLFLLLLLLALFLSAVLRNRRLLHGLIGSDFLGNHGVRLRGSEAETAGKVAEVEVENCMKRELREVLCVRKFKKFMGRPSLIIVNNIMDVIEGKHS